VTAFGLAISLSWSWALVIVLGWYFAGVSISSHPVSEAIEKANLLQDTESPLISRFIPPKEHEYIALSRTIAGDVERAGPLYNYAKPFVWNYNIFHLVEALQGHFRGLPSEDMETRPAHARVDPSYRYYRPIEQKEHEWKPLVFQRMFWSVVIATVLNIATVGAAFWLDFLTPPVGIGCRSGGILIYWVISYIVWILMVVSAWISNHWSVCAAAQRIEKHRLPDNLYPLGIIAVILRLVGKGLAILNTAWISTHCLFEFTSFYDRCFCSTNRGTAPWLWLDDAAIRGMNDVQERWFGLALLTGTVCFGYIAFIGLWTKTRLQ